MNLDDARAVLGVSLDDDPERVRRAYLRLLRSCKPDADPEGFQRLRAAYELVRESLAFRAQLGAVLVVRTEPRVEIAVPTPMEPRIEIAQPIATTPIDPTEGRSIPSLVAAGDLEQAAEVARERLEFALREPEFPTEITPHVFIDLILALHADGHTRHARAVTRKLRRWLAESGLELRLIAPDRRAAKWAQTRELAELPDVFPSEVTAAIATSLRTGDKSQLEGVLARLRREYPGGPLGLVASYLTGKSTDSLFDATAHLLRWNAPMVYAANTRLLQRWSRAPRTREDDILLRKLVIGCVIIVVGVVYFVVREAMDRTNTAPAFAPTVAYESSSPPSSAPLLEAVNATLVVAREADAASADDLARAARTTAEYFPSAGCVDGIESFRTMTNEFARLPAIRKTASLAISMHVLRTTIATACAVNVAELP